MYTKAKFLGHPIHPMLTGFPVAFYTATFVAYVVYAATADPFVFRVGVVANVAGVLCAVAAAVPGFVDWAFAIPRKHPAKTVGLEHMALNVGALVLFGIDAFVSYRKWTAPNSFYVWPIALSAVGVGLTMAAGFLGWKMVQKHHVGIDMTPEQELIDEVEAKTGGAPTPSSHRT